MIIGAVIIRLSLMVQYTIYFDYFQTLKCILYYVR